jgi:septum formation protein
MKHTLKYKFILASSSKFRLSLLEQIKIMPDEILSPDIDEKSLPKEDPRLYSERMAIEKAQKIQESRKDCLILAADTVIAIGTRILHKPTDVKEAESHLNLLSGRQHRCYTTICVLSPSGKKHIRQDLTMIKFKKLHKSEIEFYLETNEWRGCAGGYTITGYAAGFISMIRGSYSGVAGLPLYDVKQILLQYFV